MRDFGSVQEFRHAFFRTAQRGGKNDCVWLLVAPDGALKLNKIRRIDTELPLESVVR